MITFILLIIITILTNFSYAGTSQVSDTISLTIDSHCTFTTTANTDAENKEYSATIETMNSLVSFPDGGRHYFSVTCNEPTGYSVISYATPLISERGSKIPYVTSNNFRASGDSSWTAKVSGGNTGALIGASINSRRIIKSNSGVSDPDGDTFDVTYQVYVGDDITAGTYSGTANYAVVTNIHDSGEGWENGGGDNIISGIEAVGTVHAYGLTITSEENGIYIIDGTATTTAYARLSHYMLIASHPNNLVNADAPNNTTILEKGKYYNLEFKALSGSHNVDTDNVVRFVFRPTNETVGYQYFGYDFNSGFFGLPTSPIRDDLGMFSLYVVQGYSFDNFRFQVSVYEVIPDNPEDYGEISESINACGVTINFYDQVEVIELIGRATNNCYVDLENRVSSNKTPNTSGMPILYPAGKKATINYEYIKNAPTGSEEVAFTFRNSATSSSSLAAPKISSNIYSISTDLSIADILPADSPMFSIFFASNATFDHYQFRVTKTIEE